MRVTSLSFLPLLLLAACATGGDRASTSWGKPGVSLVQYWTDASECALAGAQADVQTTTNLDTTRVGGPDPVQTNVAQSSRTSASSPNASLDRRVDLNEALMNAHYNEMVRRREEASARQAAADSCLTGRGYQRFRLTAEQQANLDSLAEGSTERRAYLHRLGADSAVLDAQRTQ
jgi:hypothetical protein